MSEQWYLDLDGVRSGPYQTSEVMSLVAEGEILPHHQIALELKSQKWMTILEWRLNQNRSSTSPEESSSPVSVSPAQESAKVPVEPLPIKTAPPPVERPSPAPKPIAVKPISTPPPPSTPPTGKRDPMAEMFDMLQNTKQKREVKAQQSHAAHAQSHTPSHNQTHMQPYVPITSASTAPIPPYIPEERKSGFSKSNLGKTILIGAGITILGFVLGQFFQHQKSVEPSASKPASTDTVASPSTASTPVVEKETEQQTIDRSTDKMTIRGKVPVNNAASSPSPEHPKDAQELKDLKKELLELKALKDEIRNNNNEDDPAAAAHMGPPPGSNYEPPEPNANNPPETAPQTDPNGNTETPASPNEKDVHY